MQEAYNDYVTKHKREQEYEFYKEHKSDPWFIEKYDPALVYKFKLQQFEMCRKLATQFKGALTQPEYLAIKLQQEPDVDYNLCQTEDGKDLNIHRAPLFAFDADTLTIYMKYIPSNIKRADLEQVLKSNVNGLVYVSMSEPMKNHSFNRLAWASFQDEHSFEQAL